MDRFQPEAAPLHSHERPEREDDEKLSIKPEFIGWQELHPHGRMALFNLKAQLGEHPSGSTVSDRTLMIEMRLDVKEVAALIP